MDQPEHWTNPTYLIDFIAFIPDPKRVDPSKIASLYTERRLSCYQIADRIGLSKTSVARKIRKAGVKERHRGRSKTNYRFKNPPYGYRVVDSALLQDRNEMRVIRLIVEKRGCRGRSTSQIAMDLNFLGITTRIGRIWKQASVQAIYVRWKNKV